jgi:hypothetical protein
MFLKFLVTVLALVFVSGGLLADEIKGKITKLEEGKITLTVDGKEMTYTVDKKVKVQSINKKKTKTKDVEGGFTSLKPKDEVTLTTEKKDDQEVVTKITTEAKKKKKDK